MIVLVLVCFIDCVLEDSCCGPHEGACPSLPYNDLNASARYVIIGLGALIIIAAFVFVLFTCRKRIQTFKLFCRGRRMNCNHKI